MSIRVTCPKCHARFNVSEKFAGKEGPCPKCKATIRVPLPSEDVVISAPKQKGPVDTEGRAIVDPIRRKETALSMVQIVLIAAAIVGFLVVALVMRFMVEADTWNNTVGWVLLGVGAVAVAVPAALMGYVFFRDQEIEGFAGSNLYSRIGACAVIYALAWLLLPVAAYAFGGKYEIGSYVLAAVAMFAAGAVTAMACFEFEWLMGAVHYGLYFGIALLGRFLTGLPALPVSPERTRPGLKPEAATELLDSNLVELVELLRCTLSSFF